jgi:hypothetical protein
MTRHVGEDTLLKLALGLLSASSEKRVRNHLKGCPECQGLMEDVDRTLGQIKDVTPGVTAGVPALPSLGNGRYKWLRIAAMLAVGFGLGFFTAESLRSPSIDVIPQQIVPMPPKVPVAEFVPCDGIDL